MTSLMKEEDRSTRSTLERLEATGSLEQADYEALSSGYTLLAHRSPSAVGL